MTTLSFTLPFIINYLTLVLLFISLAFIIRGYRTTRQLSRQLKYSRLHIGGIGHDLKNKITTIQLYTQIMQQKYPKQAKNMLLEIENMTEIVNNLTLEAVFQDNRLCLKKEKFELVQFLQSIINIKNIDTNHTIVFESSLKSAEIIADKIALDRIMQNIIQNAIKYSPPHAPILVQLKKIDKWYQIAIKDKGQGIPKSAKSKIFKAYQQLGKTQGMGLGLHIVKTLVTQHSGRIYFVSQLHQGTTFFVELPKMAKGSE